MNPQGVLRQPRGPPVDAGTPSFRQNGVSFIYNFYSYTLINYILWYFGFYLSYFTVFDGQNAKNSIKLASVVKVWNLKYTSFLSRFCFQNAKMRYIWALICYFHVVVYKFFVFNISICQLSFKNSFSLASLVEHSKVARFESAVLAVRSPHINVVFSQ